MAKKLSSAQKKILTDLLDNQVVRSELEKLYNKKLKIKAVHFIMANTDFGLKDSAKIVDSLFIYLDSKQ
ncbi:MAG: hypothetical protein IIA45_07610 [Bacteroidetes bacterium]|nr:hypothetical protein [Bacteroidota bacterium]